MKLVIKTVRSYRNGDSGRFYPSGLITIARDKNGNLAEFGVTLLHELLHFWIQVLRVKGAEISEANEHRFIDKLEWYLYRNLNALK